MSNSGSSPSYQTSFLALVQLLEQGAVVLRQNLLFVELGGGIGLEAVVLLSVNTVLIGDGDDRCLQISPYRPPVKQLIRR